MTLIARLSSCLAILLAFLVTAPVAAQPQPASQPSPTPQPAPTPRGAARSVPVPTPPAPQPTPRPPAAPFTPFWVQNHRATQLWSGLDREAVTFGVAPPWSYFQVVEPQSDGRLRVLDARTGNFAFVEAVDVGPSGPPPEAEPSNGVPRAPLQTWWVANHAPTPLWSAPDEDAIVLGQVSPWTVFEVLEPQAGARLHVRDPRTGGEAYLDAAAVGPVGPPEALSDPLQWWGFIGVDRANVRSAPTRQAEVLAELPMGTPVLVRRWVEGEEVVKNDATWAELADGMYLWAQLVRQARPSAPPPPPRLLDVRQWIDVNLTLQIVTAYEADQPVYWATTSSGRPGWETPTGIFTIQRRVEKETMDSQTLLGRDAERADYRVEDVRWTQYFTAEGHALHENYWKPPDTFGVPSSHGCLGLLARDAEWFWNWASVGTPVFIHP